MQKNLRSTPIKVGARIKVDYHKYLALTLHLELIFGMHIKIVLANAIFFCYDVKKQDEVPIWKSHL